MSSNSVADELRQAELKIRELATKAAPGPWCPDYTYAAIRHVQRNCDLDFDCDVHTDRDQDQCRAFGMYDGPYVAMWHPGVALLVAELLDANAIYWERIERQNARPGDGLTRVMPNEGETAALKLARAINGSE